MKKIIAFILVIASLASCFRGQPKPQEQKSETESSNDSKSEMIEADKAFSKMSEEKGMKAAFIEYLDSDGVLLRPNSLPLKGANAIDYISQSNDSSFSLSWEPRGAAIAKSGDLGFTYGVWLIKFKSIDSVKRGTYISVWKKQADGKWKYVVDGGNDGVGEMNY